MDKLLTRRLDLAATPESIRIARRFVRDIATDIDLPAPSTAAAELAVSELTTNAIVHGRPPIELLVDIGLTEVRVAVHDTHRASPAAPTGGHGLAIVGAVTAAWGRDADTDGTSFWFTVLR